MCLDLQLFKVYDVGSFPIVTACNDAIVDGYAVAPSPQCCPDAETLIPHMLEAFAFEGITDDGSGHRQLGFGSAALLALPFLNPRSPAKRF